MTSSASIATDNISALLDIIRPGIAGELVSNPGFSLMDKSSTELWIGNLSASNFANTAKELYRILPVATKLDIDPVTKMEILDSLTPTVIRSTECLLQSQLNQETQLFINISAQSFSDPDFLPWLNSALEQSQLPANSLIFQFREIDAVRYLKQAAAICEQMKKSQGQVSIANFGLAINPLKTLERVAADFVKVDRLIVEKLQKDEAGKAEFQKLIGGMTGTGVDVIVPFVEKATIIPTLWQQGVQYIQGHYIQKPAFTMDYDFSEGP